MVELSSQQVQCGLSVKCPTVFCARCGAWGNLRETHYRTSARRWDRHWREVGMTGLWPIPADRRLPLDGEFRRDGGIVVLTSSSSHFDPSATFICPNVGSPASGRFKRVEYLVIEEWDEGDTWPPSSADRARGIKPRPSGPPRRSPFSAATARGHGASAPAGRRKWGPSPADRMR